MKTNSRFKQLSLVGIVTTFIISTFSVVFFAVPTHGQSISSNAADYGLTVTDSGDRINLNPDDVTITWVDAATMEIQLASAPDIVLIAKPDNEGGGDAELDDQRSRRRQYDQKDYSIIGWECDSKISWSGRSNDLNNPSTPVTSVNVDIDFRVSSAGSCEDTTTNNFDKTAQSSGLSTAYFTWVDSGTIERVDGQVYGQFIASPDPALANIFLRASENGDQDGCQDRILVGGGGTTATFYELDGSFGGDSPDTIGTNCDYRENFDKVPESNVSLPLVDPINADGVRSSSITAGEGQSASVSNLDTNGNAPTCESGGLSLSWVICPIINAALDSMDWMFRQFIEPFLTTQPLTTDDDNFVYQVWKGFRTIGNILLVFMLLFVVFGQTIGGGLVDAYTAKKAMPRILAAAIFINLSYFAMGVLLDIFNILGAGIAQLITAPLEGNGSFSFKPNELVNAGGLLAVVLGGNFILGLTATSGFLPLLLMTVLIPMLIVVVSIFGTIIIRRGLIVLLVIIAPVASALFVLPNTEKYAKQWFSLLIKTLMVYPIIMAIFGVADLLSVMLVNVSSGSDNAGIVTDSLSQFVGIIVLFIPFFLIPFAFKFAGGAIGSISATLTGFGKKRHEKYMGSEMDPNSRISKRKEAYKDARDTGKKNAMGRTTAKRMANFRRSRARRRTRSTPTGTINPLGGVGSNDYGPSVPPTTSTNDPSINPEGGVGGSDYGPSQPVNPEGGVGSTPYGPPRPGGPGGQVINPEGGVGPTPYGPASPGGGTGPSINSSGGVGTSSYGPDLPTNPDGTGPRRTLDPPPSNSLPVATPWAPPTPEKSARDIEQEQQVARASSPTTQAEQAITADQIKERRKEAERRDPNSTEAPDDAESTSGASATKAWTQPTGEQFSDNTTRNDSDGSGSAAS